MLFPLSCAISVPAPAQTAKHTAAARQHAADEASRNQLADELAEFQGNPEDAALRSRIIQLAKSLDPAPAIPQLAQDDFAKAAAQMAAASSADDFDTVAQLFEQVAVQAPWYADAYYDAASAYVKAGKFDAARHNLAFYLAAMRPGVDNRNTELLRRELERMQTEQFQQALQSFTANPTDAARLHVIQLAQAMETPPEIPEEARGHYVMATVFSNSATDNGDYERAIAEYKAALLAAPWWADAYKKLAGAQTLAGHYDDAITTLIFYQAVNPADARSTQDEIYRLKALGQTAAAEQAKKQAEDQRRKTLQEQQQKALASAEDMSLTVEGRWYLVSAPGGYFVSGESNPGCDYLVKQTPKKSEVKSSCSPSTRTIDNVDIQPRKLTFKLLGRDSEFPFSEVIVTLGLSSDGQILEGTAVSYDKRFRMAGEQSVRWKRRK